MPLLFGRCFISRLLLETRIVYKPGVVLNFELTTRDGAIILIEGQVQWSKRGTLRLNHIMKSGMGVFILKFLQGEDVYRLYMTYRERDLHKKKV